ncbi:hypothetical protein AB0D57_27440 [Streptomyces sp. NPDC048275]|uniref:hypothetical protein n=1 Tax=Streptomyces sp. NPDC048275 TaxID=3155629 RepID=UPI0033CDCE9E
MAAVRGPGRGEGAGWRGDGEGRAAGVDGLLVGGQVPVCEGLGRASRERRQDDAVRGVGIAVALF